MRISVKVKTNARTSQVRTLEKGRLEVSVHAPPVDGKANEEVIALLAGHFGKLRRSVRIRSGHSSKNKIVEVDD